MQGSTKSVALQALGLVALGVLVGVANNLIAGPTRRLAWVGDYPDKEVKDCRKEPATPVAVAPTGPPPAPSADPEDLSAVALPAPSQADAYTEVDSLQALKAFRDGALFVDARMTDHYVEGHVQGALSIPVWETAIKEERMAKLPFDIGDPNRVVIAYCNGGDCEDSHSIAAEIRARGYANVYVYKDGWPDWSSKGRPSKTGAEP